MTRIRWTPQAVEDLAAIRDYIERDSPHYARHSCTFYSNVSGGTPPYSYQWSGALYGTTANIVGSLPESNDLTFKVTDAWGNSRTDTQWITVDDEFEECIY